MRLVRIFSDAWLTLRAGLSILFVVALLLVMGPAVEPPGESAARVRAFTRAVEFDYAGWIVQAFGIKLGQAALGTASHLSLAEQHDLVIDYLKLVEQVQLEEFVLAELFTNPEITDPAAASAEQQMLLDGLYARRAELGPLAESILQNMVTRIAAEQGFTLGGQPIPPVLYHSTPLPWALIIAPRDAIRQEANISLEVDLTVADHDALENEIESSVSNVSALVVPIGGVGAYPTMVAQTTNLNWLAEVIAHEWMHNYLTLRPLGLRYEASPELRTMNETTASIFGKELGALVIERYFPEFVPPPPAPPRTEENASPAQEPEPPAFDFRAEMRHTRVVVDSLLAQGEITVAEQYMETRRAFFWDNGYRIRKLNQAYFAFYGAYADVPGGAAGEDPVGAAVRALRARSANLLDFVRQIAWLTDFGDLQALVAP
jgi:hypothetical protein